MISSSIAPSYLKSIKTEQPPAPDPNPPLPPVPDPPEPGPDVLDFSKLDTPVKAALLPANEPAVQVALVAGVLFAVMAGGMSGAVPLITLDLASKSADKAMNVSYNFDLKDQESPLTASGSVADQDYSDKLAVDEGSQSASLVGNVGDNQTKLTLSADQNTGSLTVSGQMGDVAQSLTYTAIKGPKGNDDIRGLHTEGNIGGQAYTADLLFAEGAKKAAQGEEAKMTFRGKLGDADISKDYTLKAQQIPTGLNLIINGSGTTAGVPQDVSVNMNLVG